MSIKTKYHVVSEGESLAGTTRSRDKVGPSVKFYTDFTITSTDNITDYSTQATFDASANASITSIASGTATNSTAVLCSAAASPDSGTLYTAAGTSSLLFFVTTQIRTSQALMAAGFGIASSGVYIGANATNIAIDDGTTAISSTTETYADSDDILLAMFLDKGSDLLYVYEAKDQAAVSQTDSVDASALGSITLPGNIKIGGGTAQDMYSMGLVVFDTTPTTTQVESWLATINSNYNTTNKKLPDDWIIPV